VVEFARRLEADGADQLWLIEDCFYTAGVSLAAAALAVTERISVGLGILPAVARNPAITAMEIATLCQLGSGRVLAGIGHGVQDWMGQIGARTPSPVTTLAEVIGATKRLLAGERITTAGRHVRLTDVALDHPPSPVPPVLAGVRGPRSLAMAGRVADGVVLAEGTGPFALRAALAQAAPAGPFHAAVFAALCVMPTRAEAFATMAPYMGALLDQGVPALAALPFHDEMQARWRADGAAGLASMPSEWWAELGPIGTIEDAIAHVSALGEAGAVSVALFPAPDLAVARAQLDDVAAIVRALR
jgi:alkanesulfonate monooxygenase SsuD/methylene tetrahydromethanopterin reductase-like flavin-dependent oxidoreductase (luciferase family)